MARKKIAAMQIRDDDEDKDEDDNEDEDDDDDEQFKRLFSQNRSNQKKKKKNQSPALFSARNIEDLSDVSVSDRVICLMFFADDRSLSLSHRLDRLLNLFSLHPQHGNDHRPIEAVSMISLPVRDLLDLICPLHSLIVQNTAHRPKLHALLVEIVSPMKYVVHDVGLSCSTESLP